MPDLPPLSLSQEHFDRVVAVFPGNTLEEKGQSYQNWLVNRLLDHIELTEMRRAQEAIISSLPPRPPDPTNMEET